MVLSFQNYIDIGWNFPAIIYPKTNFSKLLSYRLIARIVSQTPSGQHFKTIIRSTDDCIYIADGMAKHSDAGVQSVSQFEGRGSAIRLNKSKNKDISAIIGRHKNTTAVFYVLEEKDIDSSSIQKTFWLKQWHMIHDAIDIGPIDVAPQLNILRFASFKHHTLNTWIPCTETDITWTENLSKLHWEFKIISSELSQHC